MPLHLTLELAGVMSIGDVYAFVDQARAAGVPPHAPLEIESEDDRVPAPDLRVGLDPQLAPGPVLVPDAQAASYADALGRMLAQESSPDEERVLFGLLDLLYRKEVDD